MWGMGVEGERLSRTATMFDLTCMAVGRAIHTVVQVGWYIMKLSQQMAVKCLQKRTPSVCTKVLYRLAKIGRPFFHG